MRLTDWQQAFEHYLLSDDPSLANPLLSTLVGGPTLAADTGLMIYHNAYRARLLEVLRTDYPACCRMLGPERFDALAQAYLVACPSRHYSLRWLGEQLEGFAQAWLGEGSEALTELIRLEWAFTLAFDAPDGEPLTLPNLAQLPAEQWPTMQFGVVPSVQWLTCRYNTVHAWQAARDPTQALPISKALVIDEVCLVWRNDLRSRYRSLSSMEADALTCLLKEGANFTDLCAQLSDSLGEGAALQAATFLKLWVQDGLLERKP